MLESLTLQDFTVFHRAEFRFGKNLNVIVGENGSGKTHILKAAYAGIAAGAVRTSEARGTKAQYQIALASKLIGAFRPDSLGRLVRRAQGRLKCKVTCSFDRPELDFGYSFSRMAKTEVNVSKQPAETFTKRPVYLPTRDY